MTQQESTQYDAMIEYNIATEDELNLARCLVCGTWKEVLDTVCNVRTGYKTWEQYVECELMDE